MYNLLVVDDESIIADGLYEAFLYNEELELEVFKAYSATEALKIASTIKIDVTISDIAMPRMNGLELHKEISRLWPQCKTIFLTGYDHFEYVQTAIRNEAIDYILKSESDEAVLEAVKKTISLIEKEKNEKYAIEKASYNMSLAFPMLQTRFIGELADGMDYSAEERKKRFIELEMPLNPDQPFLMLLGSVDFWPQDFNYVMQINVFYGLKNIVVEYLSNSVLIFPVEYSKTKLIWLIQPLIVKLDGEVNNNISNWEKTATFVKGMMNTIQSASKELLKVSVSFATNGLPVNWDEIAQKLDSLIFSMTRSFVFGNEVLFIDERQMCFSDNEELNLSNTKENEARKELKKTDLLGEFLESGKSREFKELFHSMMAGINMKRPFSYDLGVEIYFSISLMFLSYLNKSGLRQKIGQRVNLYRLTKMDEHMPWDKITEYFTSIAESIFSQNDTESLKNANRIFSFIKNYTEQHIIDDLTLTKFSELLHFHPFYLSRLFKQVTGMSLSEYVLESKIRRACDLMKQENMKINEIAAYLGFTSSSYFAKVFKKYANLNPQEYKDSLKLL